MENLCNQKRSHLSKWKEYDGRKADPVPPKRILVRGIATKQMWEVDRFDGY